jgi:hypothetical protein
MMHFVSEIYNSVPLETRYHHLTPQQRNSIGILLIQNNSVDRHLKLKGKNLLPNFAQSYYSDLLQEYYRVQGQHESSQAVVSKLLANFFLGLSNSKSQLKIFYDLGARIINLFSKLKENGIEQYYAGKVASKEKLSETLFAGKEAQNQAENVDTSPKQSRAELNELKVFGEPQLLMLKYIEDNIKLINLMLGDHGFITELAGDLFSRDEHKIKVKALREFTSVLHQMMDLGSLS